MSRRRVGPCVATSSIGTRRLVYPHSPSHLRLVLDFQGQSPPFQAFDSSCCTVSRAPRPSLEEASSFLRARPLFAAWDPRALAGYLQGGFGPCPSEGEKGVQLKCAPTTEAAYYRGSGTTVWPHLNRIATTRPVAVLAGQESTHMDVPGMGGSAAVFRQMVSHMGPLASLAMVPQCSHFLPMERPHAVAERIAALLRAAPDAKL